MFMRWRPFWYWRGEGNSRLKRWGDFFSSKLAHACAKSIQLSLSLSLSLRPSLCSYYDNFFLISTHFLGYTHMHTSRSIPTTNFPYTCFSLFLSLPVLQLTVNVQYNFLPIIGFEPWTGSDRSTNWVTTPGHTRYIVALKIVLFWRTCYSDQKHLLGTLVRFSNTELKWAEPWSGGYRTHVPKVMGLNPGTVYWMDFFHINLL